MAGFVLCINVLVVMSSVAVFVGVTSSMLVVVRIQREFSGVHATFFGVPIPSIPDVGNQHQDEEDRHHASRNSQHVFPVSFPDQVHEHEDHQHCFDTGDTHHENPRGGFREGPPRLHSQERAGCQCTKREEDEQILAEPAVMFVIGVCVVHEINQYEKSFRYFQRP